MDPSFGARLRSERERQQIALRTIADRTKIKLSLLEALERDDVSQWPCGIFRRSHVRTYALAIGLEPDAVVREFLEIHPDPAEEIPAILEAVQQAGGESANRPRTRIRFLVDAGIDALRGRRRQRLLPGESGRILVDGTAAASGRPQAEPASVASHVERPDERTPSGIERELTALAHLCTRLGRAQHLREVVPVLEEASELIDAVGLVLWLWDQDASVLTPALALGYSNDMVTRLPSVPRDADNAIAAAFRSAETRIVRGTDVKTGAVVVPAVAAAGCFGVLAVELPAPGDRRAFVCAFAAILAAQLAGLVEPACSTLKVGTGLGIADTA
jgi:transcriptional regulator with XRE-family HTH domain